eukprot:CAMPEP_0185165130 /NCGR_PEP_ID=MMETSP1139-20130426/10463_1 /TAXON_ID=298111 /ORGANISM="Pavlova sp., Strain CCMP459" /LENGTH=36 /DNA_ID= /DNA_START= /DNA_END= /DNA_ORIENTATION=
MPNAVPVPDARALPPPSFPPPPRGAGAVITCIIEVE